MSYVLDAGAMIAYLDGEPGASVTASILINNAHQCYAHAINLAEIYYVNFRRGGQLQAENAIQTLLSVGVIPSEDMDSSFWKQIGAIKGMHALSLPDAFCIALAMRLGATVATTDHNEFDPLVPVGYCPIVFIR